MPVTSGNAEVPVAANSDQRGTEASMGHCHRLRQQEISKRHRANDGRTASDGSYLEPDGIKWHQLGRVDGRDQHSHRRGQVVVSGENVLYAVKAARFAGRARPPNLGRADGPPPSLWPSAASASVIARRRRDIRRSPGPPCGSSGAVG